MLEPASAVGLTKAVAPAVEAAIKGASPSIIKQLSSLTRSALDRLIVGLGIDMSDYLGASYQNSRHFKSILNTSVPLSVMDDYLHINLVHNNRVVSDSDFIDSVNKLKHVIVTGLAGGGKGMLMRYMTLLKFERPDDVIPILSSLDILMRFGIRTFSPSSEQPA